MYKTACLNGFDPKPQSLILFFLRKRHSWNGLFLVLSPLLILSHQAQNLLYFLFLPIKQAFKDPSSRKQSSLSPASIPVSISAYLAIEQSYSGILSDGYYSWPLPSPPIPNPCPHLFPLLRRRVKELGEARLKKRGNSAGLRSEESRMMGSGVNLTTTVIGFGMSAAFIVFICSRLICGRNRSSHSQSAVSEIQLRSDQGPPEHVIRGLEPFALAAIPTMKYCPEASHSKEAQCSICLGEYQDKEMLRVMPICHHNFHLICIDVWLQKQSTCPICRLPLNTRGERLESPFSSSLQVHSAEFTDDRTWLLPVHQHSGSGSNIQEIHETVPAVFRDPNLIT